MPNPLLHNDDFGPSRGKKSSENIVGKGENGSNLDHNVHFINPFPHNHTFWRPRETNLLKTLLEKEKLLVTSNFSFTHIVFYQFRELSVSYIKFRIVVCSLFQFWPV